MLLVACATASNSTTVLHVLVRQQRIRLGNDTIRDELQMLLVDVDLHFAAAITGSDIKRV
jgi:hypothetical protein